MLAGVRHRHTGTADRGRVNTQQMEGGQGRRRDKPAAVRRTSGISEARDSCSIIKRQQSSDTLAVKDGEKSIVGEDGRKIIWCRASACLLTDRRRLSESTATSETAKDAFSSASGGAGAQHHLDKQLGTPTGQIPAALCWFARAVRMGTR